MKRHGKNRAATLLLCALLALAGLLAGCGAGEEAAEPAAASWRLIVATDLHYLAPSLTDHGELFWQVMEAGDGKVTEFCEEITDAFLAEVEAARPDALILTGDLSFNGEKESHLVLAEKLAAVEEAGVPVLVLPGNHDLSRRCYSFMGEEGKRTETVDAEGFEEIYRDFGFAEAISRDSDSLSYAAQLTEDIRLLMLDANTFHDFCSLSEVTLDWIEDQLALAEAEGQRVLAACHQNLYQHSMFGSGYVLGCSEKLQALLDRHRVPLLLSGHLHIQHRMSEGGVTEIATSALTMGACQYGVLEAEGDALRYETRAVDVAAWAGEQGLEDERLLDFAAYAMGRMERRTRAQAEAQLTAAGFSGETLSRLTEYACALNNGYFSGNLTKLPELDPDGELQRIWEESNTFFGGYFASLEPELGRDHTAWELEKMAP